MIWKVVTFATICPAANLLSSWAFLLLEVVPPSPATYPMDAVNPSPFQSVEKFRTTRPSFPTWWATPVRRTPTARSTSTSRWLKSTVPQTSSCFCVPCTPPSVPSSKGLCLLVGLFASLPGSARSWCRSSGSPGQPASSAASFPSVVEPTSYASVRTGGDSATPSWSGFERRPWCRPGRRTSPTWWTSSAPRLLKRLPAMTISSWVLHLSVF